MKKRVNFISSKRGRILPHKIEGEFTLEKKRVKFTPENRGWNLPLKTKGEFRLIKIQNQCFEFDLDFFMGRKERILLIAYLQ